MAGTIDFLGFTFNGVHSKRDLGIVRVSSNNRYNTNITPQVSDSTQTITGNDGAVLFNSTFKSMTFTIDFAFDHLTDVLIRRLKRTFYTRETSELVFDESPYKAYDVKVTGTPMLKYVPFMENGARVYKGEGSVQLIAYYPYAHTPTKLWNASSQLVAADGLILGNYSATYYTNKDQWAEASGLTSASPIGGSAWYNRGDLPTPFIITMTQDTSATSEETSDTTEELPVEYTLELTRTRGSASEVLNTIKFTLPVDVTEVKWDSKLGLLYYTGETDTVMLEYTGNGCCALPVTEDGESLYYTLIPSNTSSSNTTPTLTISYKYWYY